MDRHTIRWLNFVGFFTLQWFASTVIIYGTDSEFVTMTWNNIISVMREKAESTKKINRSGCYSCPNCYRPSYKFLSAKVLKEYPKMNYFWNPRHSRSMIAYKTLTKFLWEFPLELHCFECGYLASFFWFISNISTLIIMRNIPSCIH